MFNKVTAEVAMDKNNRIPTAIIGLGRWGQNLVDSTLSDPKNKLCFTHAMTRTPNKVIDYCDRNKLILIDSFADIIREKSIQAVVLATPHSQHSDQVIAAAKAGKHVFVEKPFTLSLADGLAAVEACKAAKVNLAVGFNRRFLPAYNELKALLNDGRLGTPLHIEGNFSGSFGNNYTKDMWRGSVTENPAGGMGAMGIHILDLMIDLLGKVKTVTTNSSRRVVNTPVHDTTTTQIEFNSGATANLTTMTATSSTWKLHLFGSLGSAYLPNQHKLEFTKIDNITETTEFEFIDTLALELNSFAETILGETDFPVKISEALAGVSAMEAIGKSAESGLKVKVDTGF